MHGGQTARTDTQLREQTIEDLPSDLALRLEACGGGCRMVIARASRRRS
jgi:hypothetical protein